MAQTHEWMFYELMWRVQTRGVPFPLPWWVQLYFRQWTDSFDRGLFDSKEAAFASNAHYRYWNMVGVKDHREESLVGQAGEVEPVYDEYALTFFLFDPRERALHLPQFPRPLGGADSLKQELEDGYLPAVITTYRTPPGIDVVEKVFATVVGSRGKSVVLARLRARLSAPAARDAWLCVALVPAGPTGFQRHDRAGRYLADRRLSFLRYLPAENRVQVNTSWGPIFGSAPGHFGLYGNESSYDPNHYIDNGPFEDLGARGALNGRDTAVDRIAGLCTAVFAWPVSLTPQHPEFELDILLPVDDYRGPDDLRELQSADIDALDRGNRAFWTGKLDGSGLQMSLPPRIQHLFDLFRTCRANLLILSDNGEVHPGPTIYDSFWVRDSSVEGIACALSGDLNLAERQFGHHYKNIFNLNNERIGPASAHGFFGGEHEKNDHEWDSNGQALWAIGRYDRIRGGGSGFGAGLFSPYVIEGARWIRDNRSPHGLLHSGWSAEHIGDKHQPHYWDDFWGIAGLWEAARLAERIGAAETGEIWSIHESLKQATADSIRWVLAEQGRRGYWETFIPTGPGDVGRLDSTLIGALAYFHPCQLYIGNRLGDDIDRAARMTLETIWHRFVQGGFRHDAAWNCYGPYLTLQLAQTFLRLGDITRMEQCLHWSVHNAAFARVSRDGGELWQVVQGAWNEQHCYPVASDFSRFPSRWWYMGDIPHGWACAEYLLLLRNMLFFEADEDGSPHIYLAPGMLPDWLGDGQPVEVSEAPTVFGSPFSFRLTHRRPERTLEIEILQQPPANVEYVYPCRFGSGVLSASADGAEVPVTGRVVRLPGGIQGATIRYA